MARTDNLTNFLTDVASAIKTKEGTNEPIPAPEFDTRILGLPSGGPTPTEVYNLRPTDWLPMTPDEEFPDNRIEMLFHVPQGLSSLIAFKVETSAGNYNVDVINAAGAVVDSKSIASGAAYTNEIFASTGTDVTSDGFVQFMVVVTGDLLTFSPSGHPDGWYDEYRAWNIFEIKMKGSNMTKCKVGAPMWDYTYALVKLRYFTFLGTNKITDASGMFAHCLALQAVLALDLSMATDANSIFFVSQSLCAIPPLNTSNVTNLSHAFVGTALTVFPRIDTSKVKDMNEMIGSSSPTITIEQIDVSSISSPYFSLYSEFIEKITFKDNITGWAGVEINIMANLSYQATIKLLDSLPTITERNDFYLSVPSGAQLTSADKAIATSKNWTLILDI